MLWFITQDNKYIAVYLKKSDDNNKKLMSFNVDPRLHCTTGNI